MYELIIVVEVYRKHPDTEPMGGSLCIINNGGK